MKVFLLSILFMVSCSIERQTIEDHDHLYENNSCIKEYFEVEESTIEQVQRVASTTTGTSISYVLIGSAYTGEFLLKVVGGIGVGVIICSPVIAVEGALRGGGNASGECIGRVGGEFIDTKYEFSKKVDEETAELRCDQYDHISSGLRRIASCLMKEENYKDALSQINVIKEDKIYKCLSDKEKDKLDDMLEEINRSLAIK